jgi:1-acyl-sn-glycerol-3-phosphate acyltransferase
MGRVPDGQCLVVAHHDGGILPMNGICLGVAWHEHFNFERPLYVLAHDLIHRVFSPFTEILPRSGVVPADRKVMDGVVETGHSLLVFPGAARESFRPFSERKTIDLGGRVGFVRQAMRHALPIVPVVSAGSHETLYVIRRGARLARWLQLDKIVRSADVMPLIAGLPWGIWILPFLPQLPFPAKITTEVLPAITVEGDPDRPEDVKAGFDRVLGEMQPALERLYAERKYPILG